MSRPRKQVERRRPADLIAVSGEAFAVACEGGGVAGDIDQPPVAGCGYTVDEFGGEPLARRVDGYDVEGADIDPVGVGADELGVRNMPLTKIVIDYYLFMVN